MITINEPKIIANSQKIIFDELHIIGGKDKNLSAVVSFIILNENNERIDTKTITYTGEDYNTFWSNFNSGKFIYQELELGIEVDNSIENDFINETSSIIETITI